MSITDTQADEISRSISELVPDEQRRREVIRRTRNVLDLCPINALDQSLLTRILFSVLDLDKMKTRSNFSLVCKLWSNIIKGYDRLEISSVNLKDPNFLNKKDQTRIRLLLTHIRHLHICCFKKQFRHIGRMLKNYHHLVSLRLHGDCNVFGQFRLVACDLKMLTSIEIYHDGTPFFIAAGPDIYKNIWTNALVTAFKITQHPWSGFSLPASNDVHEICPRLHSIYNSDHFDSGLVRMVSCKLSHRIFSRFKGTLKNYRFSNVEDIDAGFQIECIGPIIYLDSLKPLSSLYKWTDAIVNNQQGYDTLIRVAPDLQELQKCHAGLHLVNIGLLPSMKRVEINSRRTLVLSKYASDDLVCLIITADKLYIETETRMWMRIFQDNPDFRFHLSDTSLIIQKIV